jgi:hypothetical protein
MSLNVNNINNIQTDRFQLKKHFEEVNETIPAEVKIFLRALHASHGENWCVRYLKNDRYSLFCYDSTDYIPFKQDRRFLWKNKNVGSFI